MAEKMTAGQAFSAFAKKFARSTKAQDGSAPEIFHEDAFLQKKINAKEQDYNAAILTSYAKYLNPFRVLGKNSKQAELISTDEKNLLKAYTIFKAVREINATIGDTNTFIKIENIESPLVLQEAYTTGGEFIYLQCWLRFSQKATDFVPELVPVQENLKTYYVLQFSPLKTFGWTFQDKEVIAAIEAAYHPEE